MRAESEESVKTGARSHFRKAGKAFKSNCNLEQKHPKSGPKNRGQKTAQNGLKICSGSHKNPGYRQGEGAANIIQHLKWNLCERSELPVPIIITSIFCSS